MASLICTSLAIATLFCFTFNLTCCRSERFTDDSAAVWLLQATDSVEKVIDREGDSVYSSETKIVDQTSKLVGPQRVSNRLAQRTPTRTNEQIHNKPHNTNFKNSVKPSRPSVPPNLSKKVPNNEIHIEVDSLDEIGDFLNELLNNDDVDVQINPAPGTSGIKPSIGKKPDAPLGEHSKRRPLASTHAPRYTTTERPAIRTLPPVGRRPYFATPKPPLYKSEYTSTTPDPFENFWLPPSTIRVQTFVSVTPREGDFSKQTTEPSGTAQHDPPGISTAANQGEKFSQSPWEQFKNPFWGPPLAQTSTLPKTTTESSKSHAKKRPIKNDEGDEEVEYEDSEEEDDDVDEEDNIELRHVDEDERPLASSIPPVAVAQALPKTADYGVQPYQIPPTNYYTPQSPVRLDFSPLFLALIPIALFLGAAASFALSSAVTSSSAVATAQQQQQQQQEGNNNNANNANNNNANTLLALFSALYQNNNNNFNNFPYFLVINDTALIGRRRKRRAKQNFELYE